MKHLIPLILQSNNIQTDLDINILYKVGLNNILTHIEYYADKPYTCESVIKELFKRGILNYIKEKQD